MDVDEWRKVRQIASPHSSKADAAGGPTTVERWAGACRRPPPERRDENDEDRFDTLADWLLALPRPPPEWYVVLNRASRSCTAPVTCSCRATGRAGPESKHLHVRSNRLERPVPVDRDHLGMIAPSTEVPRWNDSSDRTCSNGGCLRLRLSVGREAALGRLKSARPSGRAPKHTRFHAERARRAIPIRQLTHQSGRYSGRAACADAHDRQAIASHTRGTDEETTRRVVCRTPSCPCVRRASVGVSSLAADAAWRTSHMSVRRIVRIALMACGRGRW